QSWTPIPEVDLLDPDLHGRRIGVWSTPPSGSVAPEVTLVFHRALAVLADLGAELVPIELPQDRLHEVFRVHWFGGAAQRLRAIDPALHERIDPGLREVAEAGRRFGVDEQFDAARARAAFGAAMETLFVREIDLLVSPATAIPAFAVGEELPPGSGLERWTEWAGFSYPINLTQQPAASVPAGLTQDALPVGLQIVGAKGADDDVLAAALAFEAATERGRIV
ncbi:MAG: amidase family protein, partial [Pseudomonadota bacterium]